VDITAMAYLLVRWTIGLSYRIMLEWIIQVWCHRIFLTWKLDIQRWRQ
jgi:hypothetical protein